MPGTDPITVRITPPLADVRKRFADRHQRISDIQPAHKKASIFLDQWVQKNFRSQGGNVGNWVPFKLGGRKKKGKPLDTSAKLLQDTGRLRLSFLPFATKRTAGIGSELPYSKPHEEGLGHLPRRRMLPEKADVMRDIWDIIDRHVKQAIR